MNADSETRGDYHERGLINVDILGHEQPVVPYGPVWSLMAQQGPVWSHIVLYGPEWSCIIFYGPVWSLMVLYGLA